MYSDNAFYDELTTFQNEDKFINDDDDEAEEYDEKWETGTSGFKSVYLHRKNAKRDSNVSKQKVNPLEWYKPFCTEKDMDILDHSGKLRVLFLILEECENLGEKLLVFTQSLHSLDVIEHFLKSLNTKTRNKNGNYTGSWIQGIDYLRLDGSTKTDNREALYNSFNDSNNARVRYVMHI